MGFEKLWEAFWREPSAEGLERLLSASASETREAIKPGLWEGEPQPGAAPAPCFHALSVLAGADPRPKYRTNNPSQALRLGLMTLGAPKPDDEPGGHGQSAASFALRSANRLWDRFLAVGAAPGEEELMSIAQDAFSDHLWERIEWFGTLGQGTRSIRPVAASSLFGRVWAAAREADPSLRLGSRMARLFTRQCNGRNRWSWRAQALCSPECRTGWDPLDSASGPALWIDLLAADGNEDFFDGALAEIMGEPGGPLDTDFALCKAFLAESLRLGRGRLFLGEQSAVMDEAELLAMPWAGQQTPTGASLAARWASRGRQLGPALGPWAPDYLWRVTRNLSDMQEVAEDDTPVFGAPHDRVKEHSRRFRQEMFGLIEWAWRQGSDPFWVGPDGESALDQLKARSGYQRWVARAEREALESRLPKALESEPSRSL